MKMKMGKLIDTEVLKAYVRKHGLYCDTETDREVTCKIIDAMPEVHAIPISWINDWYDRYNYAEVGDLLNDWVSERKEE